MNKRLLRLIMNEMDVMGVYHYSQSPDEYDSELEAILVLGEKVTVDDIQRIFEAYFAPVTLPDDIGARIYRVIVAIWPREASGEDDTPVDIAVPARAPTYERNIEALIVYYRGLSHLSIDDICHDLEVLKYNSSIGNVGDDGDIAPASGTDIVITPLRDAVIELRNDYEVKRARWQILSLTEVIRDLERLLDDTHDTVPAPDIRFPKLVQLVADVMVTVPGDFPILVNNKVFAALVDFYHAHLGNVVDDNDIGYTGMPSHLSARDSYLGNSDPGSDSRQPSPVTLSTPELRPLLDVCYNIISQHTLTRVFPLRALVPAGLLQRLADTMNAIPSA